MSAALADEVEVTTAEPTVLYRLYAADGSLLYVGITVNLKGRMAQHAAEKHWWPEVTRKTAIMYPSRAEAFDAESAAIRAERPRHNISPGVQGRRDRIREHQERAELPAQRPVGHGEGGGGCIWADYLKMYVYASKDDVRQWYERMVATGTDELISIFADGMDWWDFDPQTLGRPKAGAA